MPKIIKNPGYIALPLSISRGSAAPLDPTLTWFSLEELQNYARTGATAYVGQVLTYVDETSKKSTVYVIKNVDGDIQEVGSTTNPDAASIVYELKDTTKAESNDNPKVLKLYGFQLASQGQSIRKGANDTLEWYTPADASGLEGLAEEVTKVKNAALTHFDKGLPTFTTEHPAEKQLVYNETEFKAASAYAENATFSKDVAIKGKLTVAGGIDQENVTNLQVKDAVIVANADGTTLSAKESGLVIRKNTSSAYGIVYDATDDTIKLGLGTYDATDGFIFNTDEGKAITIRDGLVGGNLVQYDSTKRALVDSGKKISDLALASDIPDGFEITPISTDFEVSAGTNGFTINLSNDTSKVIYKSGNDILVKGNITANGTRLTGNLGTVTSIVAGGGLTTSGDAAASDGRTITASGTLYHAGVGEVTDTKGATATELEYITKVNLDKYGHVSSVDTETLTTEKVLGGYLRYVKFDADLASNLTPDRVDLITSNDDETLLGFYLHPIAKSGSYNDLSNTPNLDNYVTLDGNQTITGVKTFTNKIVYAYNGVESVYIGGLTANFKLNTATLTNAGLVFDSTDPYDPTKTGTTNYGNMGIHYRPIGKSGNHLAFPENGGTLALTSDITGAMKSVTISESVSSESDGETIYTYTSSIKCIPIAVYGADGYQLICQIQKTSTGFKIETDINIDGATVWYYPIA